MHINPNAAMNEVQFTYTHRLKKKLLNVVLLGVVLVILGSMVTMVIAPPENVSSVAQYLTNRLWANAWINNVYFVGLALSGVLFVALQYVTQSGWSAALKRIPEAFGYWLPIGGVLMLAIFLLAKHVLFHWTHDALYNPTHASYDPIIASKRAYLNTPFYIVRMVIYFSLWFGLFQLLRKASLAEDRLGGVVGYKKMVKYAVFFIVVFAITSSAAAWDWVLSIDTHWYSTLFGWYIFSSWFVAGLAVITLLVVLLQEQGYLPMINANHLHDFGKFLFAFSIFWAYLWLSQFLLIYYANIPEESIYFVERLTNSSYSAFFFANLILNFFSPFLALMTRDAKRHGIFLKIICIVILVGHWLDFYLMITPGVLAGNGNIGLIEIGVALIYFAAFLHVILKKLASAPLVAQQHPLLQESLQHHVE